MGGWFVKTDNLGFALPNGADTLYHIGISDKTEEAISFKIFPNPTFDKVNIVFEKIPYSKFQIQLFDVTGQLIQSKDANNQSNIDIDIIDLKKGIYILNIKSNIGWIKSVKIVKN